MIEDRRRLTLKCVQALYLKIAKLERELAQEKRWHQEACAREVWVVNQFVQQFPSESTQKILIDLQVNDMDRDFSFKRAVGVEAAHAV